MSCAILEELFPVFIENRLWFNVCNINRTWIEWRDNRQQTLLRLIVQTAKQIVVWSTIWGNKFIEPFCRYIPSIDEDKRNGEVSSHGGGGKVSCLERERIRVLEEDRHVRGQAAIKVNLIQHLSSFIIDLGDVDDSTFFEEIVHVKDSMRDSVCISSLKIGHRKATTVVNRKWKSKYVTWSWCQDAYIQSARKRHNCLAEAGPSQPKPSVLALQRRLSLKLSNVGRTSKYEWRCSANEEQAAISLWHPDQVQNEWDTLERWLYAITGISRQLEKKVFWGG